MSAELLALAVRAADAYAKVKGPWLRHSGLEAYPDAITPHELVVRALDLAGRRVPGMVIFNPLPRKEIPMPASPLLPEGAFTVHASTRIGGDSDRLCGLHLSFDVHGSPAMVTIHLGHGSHVSTTSPGWLRELGGLFTRAAEALEEEVS